MSWIEQWLRRIDRVQQQHSVLGFAVGVLKKFGDDQGGKHAALLAFYGFVSLFPLLLVLATIMAFVLEHDPELQQRVIDTAVAQFPVVGAQLRGTISTIRGSGIGLVVGILGTLWGGLGITQTAQDAMNAVWNVPRRDRPTFVLRLVRSGIALLLTATALFGATALAGRGAIVPGALGTMLSLAGALLLNVLLVTVLFQVLTAPSVPWLRLAPGAAAAAVTWSVLQAVGVAIVTRQVARANLLYGVFAVVLVLLSWLLLTGRVLVYAAEINVVLARRLWPRSLLQPPLTAPDKRVLIALAEAEQLRPEQRVEVTFPSEPDEDDDATGRSP